MAAQMIVPRAPVKLVLRCPYVVLPGDVRVCPVTVLALGGVTVTEDPCESVSGYGATADVCVDLTPENVESLARWVKGLRHYLPGTP